MKFIYFSAGLILAALLAFGFSSRSQSKLNLQLSSVSDAQTKLLKQYDARDDRYRLIDLDGVSGIDWLNENFPLYPVSNALNNEYASRMMIDLRTAKLINHYSKSEDPEYPNYKTDYIEVMVGEKATKLVLTQGLGYEEVQRRWEGTTDQMTARALLVSASKYEEEGGKIIISGQLQDIITIDTDQFSPININR